MLYCIIIIIHCILGAERELLESITNQTLLQMSWTNQDQLLENIIYLLKFPVIIQVFLSIL